MKRISKFGGKGLRPILWMFYITSIVTANACKVGSKQEQIGVIDEKNSPIKKSTHHVENGLPILTPNGNFNNLVEYFSVNKDTVIKISAVGEGVDYSINKSLIKSYDNDCVEVYFDLLNNKYPTFDANGDDRQYRIVWKLLSIDGINNKNNGVIVKQKNEDETHYVIYIAFPWKTLGFVKPVVNKDIGFDVAVDDNDGATRKALFAWTSKEDIGWNNTSVYGTLNLSSTIVAKGSKALSINMPFLTKENFMIEESVWKNKPKYELRNVINGNVSDNLDLSGYFQSVWSDEYLFLKVAVQDNVKRYAQVMYDYGWIETESGKPLWTMEMSNTKHAGGSLKNRICDTTIAITKGKYKLHYKTDESHSPGYWDDEPPEENFYGIKLWYAGGKN